LVEQRIRNAKVAGSIPVLGNTSKPSLEQAFKGFLDKKLQENPTSGGLVGETMATRGKTSLIKKEQAC
jgi:hypothetical protein